MEFRECMLCGQEGVIYAMDKMHDVSGNVMGWVCRPGKCLLPKSPPIDEDDDDEIPPWEQVRLNVRNTPEQQARFKKELDAANPLQEEFGFKKPEDGSEKRYDDRRARTPWARHTFWWWLHNAVAHPLIAFVPVRFFFRFHDWTSRRMHGHK